ncbi:hypothetical protein OBO34_15350 [Clostridiales Family XIII bacterium ASD5510]|uniref:Uncharacterized protein n=1 Tax=Hominibacterium faecale TaxID=2839743 RepID=A0A9J6QR51_9FIRM|nr:hypothetical protein [Hominibacterium faecale]MCU7379721.1 hypothetical protein [Hominibacterium faecale]
MTEKVYGIKDNKCLVDLNSSGGEFFASIHIDDKVILSNTEFNDIYFMPVPMGTVGGLNPVDYRTLEILSNGGRDSLYTMYVDFTLRLYPRSNSVINEDEFEIRAIDDDYDLIGRAISVYIPPKQSQFPCLSVRSTLILDGRQLGSPFVSFQCKPINNTNLCLASDSTVFIKLCKQIP